MVTYRRDDIGKDQTPDQVYRPKPRIQENFKKLETKWVKDI